MDVPFNQSLILPLFWLDACVHCAVDTLLPQFTMYLPPGTVEQNANCMPFSAELRLTSEQLLERRLEREDHPGPNAEVAKDRQYLRYRLVECLEARSPGDLLAAQRTALRTHPASWMKGGLVHRGVYPRVRPFTRRDMALLVARLEERDESSSTSSMSEEGGDDMEREELPAVPAHGGEEQRGEQPAVPAQRGEEQQEEQRGEEPAGPAQREEEQQEEQRGEEPAGPAQREAEPQEEEPAEEPVGPAQREEGGSKRRRGVSPAPPTSPPTEDDEVSPPSGTSRRMPCASGCVTGCVCLRR